MGNNRSLIVIFSLVICTVLFIRFGTVDTASDFPTHQTPSPPVVPQPVQKADEIVHAAGGNNGALLKSWKPETCFAGAELDSPVLQVKCNKGEIAKAYCEMVAKYQKDKTSGVPCGQYSAGTFSVADGATLDTKEIGERKVAALPEDCNMDHFNRVVQNGEVTFDREGKLQMPSCANLAKRVALEYFTPTEALSVLVSAAQGRGILFSGDSMMRQLFLRIIAMLRGQTTLLADHYFHEDGLYILRANGKDDLIVLNQAGKRAAASDLEFHFNMKVPGGAPPAADESEVVLAMMFQWETKPSVKAKDFEAIDPALHIASYMYWWGNKDPITDIDPYITRVNRRGDTTLKNVNQEQGAIRRRYVYLTTPWTAPKTFGGVEDKNRLPRNERTSKWILHGTTGHASTKKDDGENEGGAMASHKGRMEGGLEMLLLDYAGIASSKPFPKTKDGIHYMCIWTPKYGQKTNNQKYNQNGDCEDPMNMAVAQWLLRMLEVSKASS